LPPACTASEILGKFTNHWGHAIEVGPCSSLGAIIYSHLNANAFLSSIFDTHTQNNSFDTLKAYVLANALALTLKVLDGGSENAVDTLMDNKVLTASVLAGLYLVYG
jgi:hypothetical protein